MKKIALSLILLLAVIHSSIAQEWFSSFDTAKRMALIKNKMLLVLWEGSVERPYPVLIRDGKQLIVISDLRKNEALSEVIWNYFVPVVVPESEYGQLYLGVEKHIDLDYKAKLDDDSIKIMDINGRIINNDTFFEVSDNLTYIIENYALDTSYLTPHLKNYKENQNFITASVLATKYLDYAIISKKKIRNGITNVAGLYFKEARKLLEQSNTERKSAFLQKIDFYDIQLILVSGDFKKAKRMLKRIKEPEIDDINQSLFNFLNYTTFILLKDEENAALWRAKVSQKDLTKAALILKNSN